MHNSFAHQSEKLSRQMYFASQPTQLNAIGNTSLPFLHPIHGQNAYHGSEPQNVGRFEPKSLDNLRSGFISPSTFFFYPMPPHIQTSGFDLPQFYQKVEFQPSHVSFVPPFLQTKHQSHFYPPNLDPFGVNYHSHQYKSVPVTHHQANIQPIQTFPSDLAQGYDYNRAHNALIASQIPPDSLTRTRVFSESNPMRGNVLTDLIISLPKSEKSYAKNDSYFESNLGNQTKRFDALSCSLSSNAEQNTFDLRNQQKALEKVTAEFNKGACLSRETSPTALKEPSPCESKLIHEPNFSIKTFSIRKTEIIELVKRPDPAQEDSLDLEIPGKRDNSKVQSLTVQSKRIKAFWNTNTLVYPDVFKRKFGKLLGSGLTAHSIEIIDLSRKVVIRNSETA